MSARALHHIADRLSLRPPQEESLKRLARALEAELCIVLSVNSVLPVACWAGSVGA